MRTTTLGSKGPEFGVIGLGCMGMTFSYDMRTPRDEATSVAVVLPQVSASLDRGGPPWRSTWAPPSSTGPHTNEELVGRALAGGHRERAVLATKVGLVVSDPTGGPGNSPVIVNNGRPEHVRKSIDESLRRLGL
ncbi:aldo/keto reductase [Streptomyces mirabilis]|uniref:aldo/keto reductase n=1 Tax=Streptomyces mirabilis TaxID=68239 RepID=UPI00201DCDAC|nr:aldo/keto reductase [Streptomyces mirabilis]